MTVLSDFRDALRGLRLHPGWTTAAVITLALGIGANATMLGLVDRLLLRPPPQVHDPGRVVRLGIAFDDVSGGGGRFTMTTTSYPVFQDLTRSNHSFASLAAVATADMVWGAGADARSLRVAKASGSYFGLLGPTPAAGRFFGESEDQPPAGQPVAVISYGLWHRMFDASRTALQTTIRLDGVRFQVIGVAPPDFTGDDVEPIDVWVPLHAGMGPGAWRDERGMRLVRIIGRLAVGRSTLAAAEESSIILRSENENTRAVVSALTPGIAGASDTTIQSRIATWVAAMSLVVFLIALVNVTNLLLLRAAGRRREVAVRMSLGASSGDIARARIVESLVLAVLGGTAAVFVAAWGSEAIRTTLLPSLAAPDVLLSARLIAITGAATLIAGLLTALAPAWHAVHAAPIVELKQGGAGLAGRPSVAPRVLLVIQGGLCMMLLVGSALFVLSLHRVRTQDFGFNSNGVLLAELRFDASLPGVQQDALYRQAEQQVERLPGVALASVVQAVPFLGHNVPPIAVPGREDFPDTRQQAPFLTAATPSYFRVLGMRVHQGRDFTPADRAGSPLVVIVNQAMADGLWPGENPIGRCIRVGFEPGVPPSGIHASPNLPCRTVVGVVNNARPRSIREESGQARMQYYIPFGQLPATPFGGGGPSIWGLLVRTTERGAMTAPVQRVLQSLSPSVPYADVRPLQDVLDRQMRPWLLGATMFSIFGLLALALAAVGLYGVRAYSVAQRTREIGIRMALGAALPDVVRMVLWDGLRVTTVGIALGAAAALALGRVLEPLLFNTHATNPAIYGLIAMSLAVVSVAASALPAWSAARVDPNVALRTE
jgi:predicted permease